MGKWLRVGDLTGQTFGQWTVIKFHGYLTHWAKPKRAWLCRCSCGTERPVREYGLIKGLTTQCGCASVITGHSHDSEYNIYQQMLQRCLVPKCRAYPDYGGRGITICERWLESFKNFYEDMGPRPSPKHTLDRKDNDGPYSKDNCRWATWKQQARNKRSNHRVTLDGRTMTLIEHAERLGISKITLWARLFGKQNRERKRREQGYVPKPPKLVTLNGITMTVSEHARRLGMRQDTLWWRLFKSPHKDKYWSAR